MKANDLLDKILVLSPWVDRNKTVDKIIDGNPNKELKNVLVVWRCSQETLKIAANGKYDGIIVHEPTYYFHENEADELSALPDDNPIKETALNKQHIIRDNDITVIRIHDSWDSRDDTGIAASWAKSLGLNNRKHKSEPPDCECRYDIPTVTAGELLEVVIKVVKDYQIPLPSLFGNPNQVISRVGLGAGCIAYPVNFIKMGCDIAIVCDDGYSYWNTIAFAIDRGFPIIRASHAASEEAGIQSLASWINSEFGIKTAYHAENDTDNLLYFR